MKYMFYLNKKPKPQKTLPTPKFTQYITIRVEINHHIW